MVCEEGQAGLESSAKHPPPYGSVSQPETWIPARLQSKDKGERDAWRGESRLQCSQRL